MPVQRLKEYLDNEHVQYEIVPHSTAYTAQGIAALTHTPGKQLAKTVIVKLNGRLAMAVLPGPSHVDLAQLKKATGAREVSLAGEADFKDKFPGCETGAMPPFGILYGIEVLADDSLSRQEQIAFNAGTHQELVRMAYADFARLAKPRVLKFASGLASQSAA